MGKSRTGNRLVRGGILALTLSLLLTGAFFTRDANRAFAETTGKPVETVDTVFQDIRIRQTEGQWEYSTDGGYTFSTEQPEGVTISEDSSLILGQNTKKHGQYDRVEWLKALDEKLGNLMSSIDQYIADYTGEMGDGAESFFRIGEKVARMEEGVWTFSSDGGETWSGDAPEGVEVSEHGIRIR